MFSFFQKIIQNFLTFEPTAPSISNQNNLIEIGWVVDGDSFEAKTIDNQKIKIRLYAVDAPEKEHKNMPGQIFSKEAHLRLKELLGKKAILQSIGKDHFGRTLAIVYPEQTPPKYKQGTSINEILAFEGLAHVNEKYTYMHPLGVQIKLLEKEAFKNNHGIWSTRNKYSPEMWRKKHKNF